ncbi:MAG: hypothetical protein ACTFAL_03210 [Candidatus Electronema sp. V4]|uniref:hypothetical protein n=1 Tax=Candidatus Electronema sp. V4 TaxID=3454756 RepID=UPI004055440C
MSPRKMLSPSLFVLSLSLVGGTALASSSGNKAACQRWCNNNANCDYCWSTIGCDGTRGRNIKSFTSGTGWWYACEERDEASKRNSSACNSWCTSHREDCDFCSTTFGCGGIDARQVNIFGGYGDNYYACESRTAASARNKAACENWCNARKNPAGAIYCDRCTTTNQCGPLSYEHEQWIGYGDNWHACEDYGPASERNKNNCDAWCADTSNNCHDCYDTIFCGGIGTSRLKDWGGGVGAENIGDGWYACEQYETNESQCDKWCKSPEGSRQGCAHCLPPNPIIALPACGISVDADSDNLLPIESRDIKKFSEAHGSTYTACRKYGNVNNIWDDYRNRDVFPTTKILVVTLGGIRGGSDNFDQNDKQDEDGDGLTWFCENYIFGKEIAKSVKCISSYGTPATSSEELSSDIISIAHAIENKSGGKPKIILVGKSMGGCKLQHALYSRGLRYYNIDTFFGVDTSCTPEKHWDKKEGLLFYSNVKRLQNFYQTIDDPTLFPQTGYVLAYKNQYVGDSKKISLYGVVDERLLGSISEDDYNFDLEGSETQVNVNTTGFNFLTMRKTEGQLCVDADHADDRPIDNCLNLKDGIYSYIERKVNEVAPNISGSPTFAFTLRNDGTAPIQLSLVTVKYWFNSAYGQKNIDWKNISTVSPAARNDINTMRFAEAISIDSTSGVQADISPTARRNGIDTVVSIRFTEDISIDPGSDYSYDFPEPERTGPYDRISVYYDGQLVLGEEPENLPPDSDDDGDGIAALDDNCPIIANADQADADEDGLGDVCDNKAPVAKCQDIEVALDASGHSAISPSDIDGGSFDPDSDPLRWDSSRTAFSCSDIGAQHAVTVTVTDNSDESTSCTSQVTVADEQEPDVKTKNITVQLDASGRAAIAAADVDNGSSDACGVASLALDKTEFTCADVGSNTVTLTVTDNHGNSSMATANVTVEDKVPPVAVTKNITVQLNASGRAAIVPADVDNGSSDACGIASLSADPLNFACNALGANAVTLTATDVNGNASSAAATVTVEDKLAPINVRANAPSTIIPPDVPISFTATAEDNCSVNVATTDYFCYKIKKDGSRQSKMDGCAVSLSGDTIRIADSGGVDDNIIWTVLATDQSGNTTTAEGHVLVENPGNKNK